MRLKQSLTNKKDENSLKAIESHAGFIRFIASEVKKKGIKNVLSLQKCDDLFWLKRSYDRLLDFAEECQLKMIPQKLEGAGEDGEILIKVIKASEDNGNGNGNYLQTPRYAIPDIQ